MTTELTTQFANPERVSADEIRRQNQVFETSGPMKEVLDALPHAALVINGERQTVLVNRTLLDMLGTNDVWQVLGARPGEIVDCIHACENKAGCGTSESCRVCGAVLTILKSQSDGERATGECRITTVVGGVRDSLDLLVTATPIEAEGETYSVVSMMDISGEKRRRALERIFFHDIINTAGGVQGAVDLIRGEDDLSEIRELAGIADESANRLLEEILAQRALMLAENDELTVNVDELSSRAAVEMAVQVYKKHDVAEGRQLVIDPETEDVDMYSDFVLLERVLGNMLKNALEASPVGDTVTIGCRTGENGVEFWVHNRVHMPRDVQLQVFQRSFSTKGSNRGLGTYSMRLLSERYLNGTVTFVTSEAEGTTFVARYPLRLERS